MFGGAVVEVGVGGEEVVAGACVVVGVELVLLEDEEEEAVAVVVDTAALELAVVGTALGLDVGATTALLVTGADADEVTTAAVLVAVLIDVDVTVTMLLTVLGTTELLALPPPPSIFSSSLPLFNPILNAASSALVQATLMPGPFSSGSAKQPRGLPHCVYIT